MAISNTFDSPFLNSTMEIEGVEVLMLLNTVFFKLFKLDKYTKSYGTKSKLNNNCYNKI